jgi:hypothetical protein
MVSSDFLSSGILVSKFAPQMQPAALHRGVRPLGGDGAGAKGDAHALEASGDEDPQTVGLYKLTLPDL